ncbi:MAG TPA: hypothetical protein PLG03_01520, partial [Bacteroidales bacterium]|nr:hypothetical protein [Bacteroidales bacterium]
MKRNRNNMDIKNNNNNINRNNKIKQPKFNAIWIYVILLGGIFYMWATYDGGNPLKTEWVDVKEKMAPSGDIEKISFITNMNRAEVYIKKDSLAKYKNKFGGKIPKFAPQFYFVVSSNFNAEEQIDMLRQQLPENSRFTFENEERT